MNKQVVEYKVQCMSSGKCEYADTLKEAIDIAQQWYRIYEGSIVCIEQVKGVNQ